MAYLFNRPIALDQINRMQPPRTILIIPKRNLFVLSEHKEYFHHL